MPIKPGTYFDMTNADYHADDAISSSFVKEWLKRSPLHAKHAKFSVAQATLDIGSATHAMTLEPDKDLVVRGGADRRGNQWKEAKAEAEAAGKLLLTEGDNDKCAAMADALRSHAIVGKALNTRSRACEASIFALHRPTGQMLRCRPDLWLVRKGRLGDVKTCQDASPIAFGRDIFRMGYHWQAAFYTLVMRAHGYKVSGMDFYAVEKEFPHAVAVHTLSEYVLEHSMMQVEAALDEIRQCNEIGEFSTGWPDQTIHELPLYMQTEEI